VSRLIGLTGGIGSGKSTVAAALAERGAAVVDADGVAREVLAPGGAAYGDVVARFGSRIVLADGTIDRAALAGIVFTDADALADLNRITHPVIGAELAARVAAAPGDGVVVLDIPLLTPTNRGQWNFDGVIVVDTPVDVAVHRLVTARGLTEEDATARVASQLSRVQRRALADFVVDNTGPPEALGAQVDRAWAWISSLPVRA
jgi:dephospho-CoA kinase